MQRYFYVAKHNLDQPVHFFLKKLSPNMFFYYFCVPFRNGCLFSNLYLHYCYRLKCCNTLNQGVVHSFFKSNE